MNAPTEALLTRQTLGGEERELVSFATHPSRYRHWRLAVEGDERLPGRVGRDQHQRGVGAAFRVQRRQGGAVQAAQQIPGLGGRGELGCRHRASTSLVFLGITSSE